MKLVIKKIIFKIFKIFIGNNNIEFADKTPINILFKFKTNIKGQNNTIILSNNVKWRRLNIYINGNNNSVYLSENIRIRRNLEIYIEDNNSTLKIGKNSTIESAHIALTEDNSSIDIGKDCMLSFNIDIRNGDSHCIYDIKNNQRINKAGKIKIHDNVWIGANTSILKNVEIESGSIIGTKSLMSNIKIPANTIAAGIPCKVIKYGVNWHRDRKYLD